jgi:UDP-glucose 4-epimerase
MHILVTGGAGYIGSVATRMLLDAGFQVRVLDDLSTGHRDAVPTDAEFVQVSILDELDQHLKGIDAVMHFAGKSLVGESMQKPDLYWSVNRDGSENLINAMKRNGINKLVFSSSAATYGQPTSIPIKEDAESLPTNVYGETKLAVDQLLAENSDWLSSVSLRYFNVAGALVTSDGVVGERHQTETHLIPNVINWISNKKPVQVFGQDWPTPDGTCIRDYVHVVDLIEAHVSALKILTAPGHHVINLGSGRGDSVLEVIESVEGKLGFSADVEFLPRRSGDPAVLVAAYDRALDLLDWSPKLGMDQMVRDAIRAKTGQ